MSKSYAMDEQVMDKFRQLSHEQAMIKKSWPVLNDLWASYEQVMKKLRGKIAKKFWTKSEQVVNF